jgi:hypothetical protein
LQIQSLCWRFDIKRQQESSTQDAIAKAFAVCYAPCVCQSFEQNKKQKSLAFYACRACWQNLKHALAAFNQILSLSL